HAPIAPNRYKPVSVCAESVATYRLDLINLRPADDKCRAAADDLYTKLRGAGVEVLYDDRDESPGAKFAAMDLIGLPDQLILGPRGLAAGNIEWKQRRSGARQDLPLDAAVARFAADKPLSRPAEEGGARAGGVGG